MQTPGSVTSRTSMVDSATARMSSAKTSLNLEKVNKNLIQLRNEFRADIFVKPNRSINFIQLQFVATRSGAAFEEVVGA